MIWTNRINNIVMTNTLFLNRFATRFSRLVLALKLLKIPIKIKRPKKAVIRYLLLASGLKRWYMKFYFRKKIHSNEEYSPVKRISPIMYELMIGSFFFFGFSFIYSINGGSKAKAIPARVSITIFIHSI